ncbi:MAG: hypothetical protein NTX61_01735 [Bacteroidetes bacterium]|nr:hypothetical protein [Bacteroidota bacterium]
MKRKQLFIIILLSGFLSLQAKSQTLYYDALRLSKCVDKNTNAFSADSTRVVSSILGHYAGCSNCNLQEVYDKYRKNNKFIARFIPEGSGSSNKKPGSYNFQNVVSQVGGIDVTNFAVALTDFMIERAKQELSITFFDKFKEDFKKYPELQILFPATSDLMNYLLSYDFNRMLPVLREAFIKDIQNLYINIPKLRTIPQYQPVFKTTGGKIYVVTAIFVNGILEHKNPAQILQAVAQDEIIRNDTTNLGNSVKLINLVSESLMDTVKNHIWIPVEKLTLLANDNMFQTMFFGLIYQENLTLNIVFKDSKRRLVIDLQSLLDQLAGNQAMGRMVINNNFRGFLAKSDTVTRTMQCMQKKVSLNQKLTASDISLYLGSCLDFLDQFIPQVTRVFPGYPVPKEVKTTLFVLRKSNDLYSDLMLKKYHSAVYDAIMILDSTLFNQGSGKVREGFIKYGTFLASVALAENSDQIKDAIEAVALPPGSSRIKRETPFNISLNGYLGVFGGREIMPGLAENPQAWSAGVFAPSGVAVSFGNIKCKSEAGGKSFTIFVSLIDLGTLASYRMGNDKASVVPKITLQNIISPGCYLIWGFGKCPFSLGAGAQIGPNLRSVQENAINKEQNFYWRYGAFLAVDIPYINLFTKSR